MKTKMIRLAIESVTVLTGGNGCDDVLIQTMLPCPFPEAGGDTTPLCMNFKTEPGKGRGYVVQVFGVEPELIQRPTHKYEFREKGR